MLKEITVETTLKVLKCGECHILHAIPEELHIKAEGEGIHWYCPNGHHIGYSITKLAKAKKEIEKLEKSKTYWVGEADYQAEQKEIFKRKAAAQKGAKTKILNRIQNGVCPHCNRHFENLQNHMETKHKCSGE